MSANSHSKKNKKANKMTRDELVAEIKKSKSNVQSQSRRHQDLLKQASEFKLVDGKHF